MVVAETVADAAVEDGEVDADVEVEDVGVGNFGNLRWCNIRRLRAWHFQGIWRTHVSRNDGRPFKKNYIVCVINSQATFFFNIHTFIPLKQL